MNSNKQKPMRRLQLDARNNVISEVTVNDNYYECSTCGQWHPIESFYSEVKAKMMMSSYGYGLDEVKRTRTNCKTCYEDTSDNWELIKAKLKTMKLSYNRGTRDKELKREIDLRNYAKNFRENSISVKDLKKMLENMKDDSRVVLENYDNYDGTIDESAPKISDVKEKYGIKYYRLS